MRLRRLLINVEHIDGEWVAQVNAEDSNGKVRQNVLVVHGAEFSLAETVSCVAEEVSFYLGLDKDEM